MLWLMFICNTIVSHCYVTVLIFMSEVFDRASGEILVFPRQGSNEYAEAVFSIKNEFRAFTAPTESENQLSFLTVSEPISACSAKLKPPPEIFQETTTPAWYLLADDTDCSTTEKIINAQSRGYHGLFIYPAHDIGNPSQPRPFEIELDQDSVKISVFFIGKRDGLTLKLYQFLPGKSFKRYQLMTTPHSSYKPEDASTLLKLVLQDTEKPYFFQNPIYSFSSDWTVAEVLSFTFAALFLLFCTWIFIIVSMASLVRVQGYRFFYDNNAGNDRDRIIRAFLYAQLDALGQGRRTPVEERTQLTRESLEEPRECEICLQPEKSFAVCGRCHQKFCRPCSTKVDRKCPFCRGHFE